MKAKLIKNHTGYHLWLNPETKEQEHLGSDNPVMDDRGVDLRKYKLSKQNCDEIFGVVDVEKLAKQFTIDESYGEISGDLFKGYIYGFNKAMELNKDKVFALEQMREAIKQTRHGMLYNKEYEDEFIQSLQQPTEIEVEIIKECPQCQEWGYVSECRNDCNQKFLQPKLDVKGQ